MNFDINAVLVDMLSVIKGTVTNNWEEVKSPVHQILQRKKERLELIAELRIKGELSQEKFLSRLSDETLVVEAELNALAVISKALAQKAANAAMNALEKAVMISLRL